jgi:hypothetical protein
MLYQGKLSPQLKEWMDRLAPVVEQAREVLLSQRLEEVSFRTGCPIDQNNDLSVTFLGQDYVVTSDGFCVQWANSGRETPSFIGSLILTYLATADGTPYTGRWIGFRDLPDGMFYVQAFQGYSGNRLARELKGGLEAFRRAAESLGGQRLELGSAAYGFFIFPQVPVAVVYWEGDEDFPSQAQVLFDETAYHYMSTDGLAILGSQLIGKLLKAAG